MHFRFAGFAPILLIIARLDGLVGDLRAHDFVQQRRLKRPLLRHLHGALHVRFLVQAGFFGLKQQRLCIDKLIEQHGIQLLWRHGAGLSRQCLGRGLEVAGVDGLAIDLSQYRIGIRLR